MMNSPSVGFVGGGRVARILLRGWHRSRARLRDVVVSEPDAAAMERLTSNCEGLTVVSAGNTTVARQDIVFLAIHPPAYSDVLDEVRQGVQDGTIVVSLAPKITFATLTGALGGFDRLARMIPNAASIVGKGYNPVAWCEGLSDSDRRLVRDLLEPLGESPEVPEDMLEAYAIVTGMGPTYFWPQWTELAALGEQFGMGSKDSRKAVQAMVDGAVKTLFESGMASDEVLDLIPVRPLSELESTIRDAYRSKLTALMEKIHP